MVRKTSSLRPYGTGAVMAVPAHDERDFDFATKYDIPIQRVLVMEEGGDAAAPMNKAEIEHGWMVNSPMDGFDGLYGQAAKDAVCQALEKRSKGTKPSTGKFDPGSFPASGMGYADSCHPL